MSTQYIVHYNSRRTLNFTRFFHRNYLELAYSAVCFTLPTDVCLLLSRKTMSNSHSLQHIKMYCIAFHFVYGTQNSWAKLHTQLTVLYAKMFSFPFPVSKNNRPLYSIFTSGFNFDNFFNVRMSLCVVVPNFSQIGPPTSEL